MTDKFSRDPDSGMLVGPDGCHYENEHKVHLHAVLNLCGCGNPVEAYNFCRDALILFDRRGNGPWIDAEEALRELIAAKPDVAAHVFAHVLTHLKVLEHGSTVGGSWLTDKGAAIVDLRAMTEEDDEID